MPSHRTHSAALAFSTFSYCLNFLSCSSCVAVRLSCGLAACCLLASTGEEDEAALEALRISEWDGSEIEA